MEQDKKSECFGLVESPWFHPPLFVDTAAINRGDGIHYCNGNGDGRMEGTAVQSGADIKRASEGKVGFRRAQGFKIWIESDLEEGVRRVGDVHGWRGGGEGRNGHLDCCERRQYGQKADVRKPVCGSID